MAPVTFTVKTGDQVLPQINRPLQFDDGDQIQDIKDTIDTLNGILSSDQKLCYNGTLLVNTDLIRDYSITNGSEVTLVHRDSILIRVVDPDPQKPVVKLWMQPTDSVQILKNRVYAANANNYNAEFGSTELDNGRSLQSYNITHGATVNMIDRVGGG
ncbi:hypothetical protein FRC17_001517 [Serendipita sp. 399]|nr:hypothetical protein FRC17_001517 [Serendipita sp. 399]